MPEGVARALKETGGNKSRAARILGVGRATLYRFLDEHPELLS
jgi:transcriptional regulator of acetoin/glycerol metabolism